MGKVWDVFISHATEDKNSIVRELSELLTKLKLKVWYDEFSLKVGDSLSASIDEGLINSNFGIVIISKSFLDKRWTDYEYRSLLSKEEKGKKIILPIWHNVTKEEIKQFSLYLSDKIALDTSVHPVNKIALKLTEVIRPDIFHSLKAYFLFKNLLKKGIKKSVPIDEFVYSKTPRSKLSKSLEVRARNVFLGIGQVINLTIEESIFNYELDIRPDREIQIWEVMNLCYMEFNLKHKVSDVKLKREVAFVLIGMSMGVLKEDTTLDKRQILELMKLYKKYIYEY